MFFSLIQRFFSVLFALIISLGSNAALPERRIDPVFTGSFLQSWLAASWDSERWEQEVNQMKEDGIEHLIIQSVADKASGSSGGEWTVYYDIDIPEFENAQFGENVVEAALKALSGSGIKVYIGLACFDDFWYTGGFSKQYNECCTVSAKLLKDICENYCDEYKDTLCGFYFTPEFSNIIWDSASAKMMSKGLNTVIDVMNTYCPTLPIILSPFSTNYLSLGTVDAVAFWSKIVTYTSFRDGDILAPQDAVGAAFTSVDDLQKNWKIFRTVVDSADVDLKLWANCESFTLYRESSIISGIAVPDATENKMSVPATMDRFSYQLDIASRYCDNIITFSYNHYLSPNEVDSRFIEAYRKYIANGYEVEKNEPSAPQVFEKSLNADGLVVLSWSKALDDSDIAYYRITKNGKFLTRVECMYGDGELTFTDSTSSLGDEYIITAYDTSGNASLPKTAK